MPAPGLRAPPGHVHLHVWPQRIIFILWWLQLKVLFEQVVVLRCRLPALRRRPTGCRSRPLGAPRGLHPVADASVRWHSETTIPLFDRSDMAVGDGLCQALADPASAQSEKRGGQGVTTFNFRGIPRVTPAGVTLGVTGGGARHCHRPASLQESQEDVWRRSR